MKKILIPVAGILFLASCGCKAKQLDHKINHADSTGSSIRDTLQSMADSTAAENDTTTALPPLKDKDKRSAVLGYSYFKAMRQNETRNITAYVSIINTVNEVINTLNEINSEDAPVRSNDTASVFTQNIILYKYLTITLIDPDSDFLIQPVHDSSRQKVDSTGSAFWAWAVTPKTTKRQARLILKVVAEKANGSHEIFPAKNIPITISLDRGILRSIYTWLLANPEKALVIVIIPLIIFFRKQIAAIFKRKPETERKNK